MKSDIPEAIDEVDELSEVVKEGFICGFLLFHLCCQNFNLISIDYCLKCIGFSEHTLSINIHLIYLIKLIFIVFVRIKI